MAAEAGGHRVQRVPPNERRGRVHSSTVTVAVLADGVAVTKDSPAMSRAPKDFRVEWFRGSGAGGQHRNKHANSARVIHLPTGLRQERQGRNREANLSEAMAALLARLDEMARSEGHAVEAALRASQVGSGMRSDKRRTYRFQDGRVEDHVTGKSARTGDVMRGRFDLLW